MDVLKHIQTALVVIGAALGYFVGGLDGFMIVLIIFMVIDYITGVMCAIRDKSVSSRAGFVGICKKILILVMVGMANMLDVYVIQTGSMLRTAALFFYISNEGISILENMGNLGIRIPRKIRDVLEQLHDKSERDDDDDSNK